MKKRKLLLIFITAFLFRFVLAFTTWHPDLRNHMDWGIRFFEYGPAKFFSPDANVWSYTWPNQPPGTIYIFAFVRKLYEILFSIFWWLNINIPSFPSIVMFYLEKNLYPALLKLPAILADLGIAWIIYKIFKDQKKEKLGFLGSIFFLFNPVIWYNSSLWGQTDSIINFFVLLSFYLLKKKKISLSVLFFAISLFIKLSLLIFLPVFVLYIFKKKFLPKDIIFSFALSLLFIGFATLPFSAGEPYFWLYNLYTKKVLVAQLQVITANAFNLWAALTGIHEQPQSLFWGIFSYQVWGYIIFLLVFIPLLYLFLKDDKEDDLWWILALSAFASFMFLTNMHERYLYPLFPYLTILLFKRKNLLPLFIAISFINFLNLYNFWWVPRIDPLITFMSFGDRLMPRVFGLVNFVLFLLFLYQYIFQTRRRILGV
jgi:Gpi18-like mannosyltransferase